MEYVITSGVTSTSLILAQNDSMRVLSGGLANRTTVNSGGFAVVSSGGHADSSTVNKGGKITLFCSGMAKKAAVYEGGEIIVFSMGLINGATLYNGGKMTVCADASVNNTVIKSGGQLLVASEGAVNNTTISSGGVVNFSGCYADNTQILNGGRMSVSGDAYITETQIMSGGYVNVSSDGTIYDMTVNSGGVLHLSDGSYAKGDLKVSEGGTLSGRIIMDEYVDVIVASGAVIDFTVAEQTQSSDALINDWSLISGGNNAVYTITVKADQANGTYQLAGGASGFNKTITVKTESATLESFAVGESFTKNNVTYSLSCNSGNLALNIAKASSGPVISGSSSISNATITSATVINGGILYLKNRGIANHTTIASDGGMYVSYGGTANSTIMNDTNGWMEVHNGGVVNNTLINIGDVTIFNGGTANDTTVSSGGCLYVSSSGAVNNTTLIYCGDMYVYSGGIANNTTLDYGGGLYISSGGMAKGVHYNYSKCKTEVFDGGIIEDAVINDHGHLWIHSGGTANNTTVNSGGYAHISGGILSGKLQIEADAIVSASYGATIDFTVAKQTAASAALINDWSLIEGGSDATYTITVNEDQSNGTYQLADGASGFSNTITVKTESSTLGKLSVGDTLTHAGREYSLHLNGSTLSLNISGGSVEEKVYALAATENGATWKSTASDFTVQYSTDNFNSVLSVETASCGIDTYAMPMDTYQWRVQVVDGTEWSTGSSISATYEPEAGVSKQWTSDQDGKTDLFFANANGTWTARYAAKNIGSIDDWSGTQEKVSLNGKNQLTDIFAGSTDANVLVMTDDACGDALFLDDVYSAFPSSTQCARIANLDEIRAGNGDDVVDMTSQRFTYTGDGITVRGGNGNDTIWANKGSNLLFGDSGSDRLVGASGNDTLVGGSGNDSMHGGGGSDIFCFCDDWGVDTVEQLSGGNVTLWFVSGSEECWDQATMTYTAGANSVKVAGVDKVTLKFGDDGSEQYDQLCDAGAFMESSSEKIFEESGKGILAVL